MFSLKRTNAILAERFGTDLLNNPNYRLSWSTKETEIRRGNFPIGNTGILSTEKENREVPKYPFFKDRWVLEKKCELPPTPELPVAAMHGYSYEPIFVFQDSHGNYLEPVWRAIELLVYSAIRGPEQVFNTSRTEDASKEEANAKDIQYFEDVLQEESPYLPTMLHNREAVKLDSTKVFEEKKSAD